MEKQKSASRKLRQWEVRALKFMLAYRNPGTRWRLCPFKEPVYGCKGRRRVKLRQKSIRLWQLETQSEFRFRQCAQLCGTWFPKTGNMLSVGTAAPSILCPRLCGSETYRECDVTKKVKKELRLQGHNPNDLRDVRKFVEKYDIRLRN